MTRLIPYLLLLNTRITKSPGKTGIGGVKRPPSPSRLELAAKRAKQFEALSADEFRDRVRREYEDRRAEGKLRHARTTCLNLDTNSDVKVRVDTSLRDSALGFASHLAFPLTQFNLFWLDPAIPESFPPGLLEALEELWSPSPPDVLDPNSSDITEPGRGEGTEAGSAARLRAQMQVDALRPLDSTSSGSDEDQDEKRLLCMGTGVDFDRKDSTENIAVWPEETLLQVGEYLRLSVSRFLRFTSLAVIARISSSQHHSIVWVTLVAWPTVLTVLFYYSSCTTPFGSELI